ncbi:UNVERIFIED_CONTAM: Retrovirus-related Pol polyprotein from transposon RE1 [Sesamum radiatum]|uniref:Retrovirus-related Pol polyprotein from transposon RE1 n=1 Tax=Sesamum radiatum TaxID=300843 RepID=A0AAW2R277_SESRA
MHPPKGYTVDAGMLCRLKKSLYGLEQTSRQWKHKFTSKLAAYDFIQLVHDNYLLLKHVESGYLTLLVYMDDILLTGPSEDSIADVKRYLDDLFTIKDLEYAKYFLDLEIARSQGGTSITQRKYIEDIITDTGMSGARPALSPLPQGLKFSIDEGILLPEPSQYRRLVGCLLYLGFTRLDISYPVQQLSQFLQHPTNQHMNAAFHVVCYLKGSPHTGLFYTSSNSFQLATYTAVDWASCVDSRQLTRL